MSVSAPYQASILLLALAASAAVGAASSSSKGAVAYRWVDEQGVVHYGDRVPPQYSQQERTVLNSEGVEVKHLDAQKTAEQFATEAHQRDEALRLKQHDSFLLTTYTSVKDIEALRDQRLDQLKGQQIAAQQYVDTLHSRLSALQSRALHFKPYSDRGDAHQMPDDLAEDLVRTLTELRTQNNTVVTRNEEQVTLRAQFQADIERYRQLHVVRAP